MHACTYLSITFYEKSPLHLFFTWVAHRYGEKALKFLLARASVVWAEEVVGNIIMI